MVLQDWSLMNLFCSTSLNIRDVCASFSLSYGTLYFPGLPYKTEEKEKENHQVEFYTRYIYTLTSIFLRETLAREQVQAA